MSLLNEMKLKDLERKGHLYYANSTSDIARLEEAIICGISKNQFDGLWFCSYAIPLFTDLDISIRVSLMEREHKKDKYGFVMTLDQDKISKKVKKHIRNYLPIGNTGRLSSIPINKRAIDGVYLFDFVGDKKELSLQSKYLQEKYGVCSRASRVYTRRQGNLTNLLAQELKIS